MDRIVFYNGEETGYVVERTNFNNSFFAEQYASALKLFKKIYCSTGPVSNIIAFCGDRGEGKTSCMRSFMELLGQDSELDNFDKKLPFNASKIELLDVVDPAFFDKKHNLIELVLGQMYGRLTQKALDDEEYSSELSKKQKLLNSFQKAKMCLAHLEKEKKELYDPLEELEALSAGINLQQCLGTLFEEYLKFQGKEKIVLAIDDLDLNMTEGYRMAEQIRKYLNQQSCILLIGLNIGQLTEVIKNSIAKELDVREWEYEDLPTMAMKYVIKLFPYGNRVFMPSINDLCEVKLQICDRGDSLKELNSLNSVKDEVTRLIFRKTRYLFYNEKGNVSPIVPRNLRSLRLLLGMLLQMEDFKDNASHAANKRVFKSYFFREWTKCLAKGDQDFVNGLIEYLDLGGINKYVMVHFPQEIRESGLDDTDGTNISEQDISLGQVLDNLSYVAKRSTSSDEKLLIFFVRSFYSMKLYELYDVISETQNGIYPIASSDDNEVVKVDTLFRNFNQLQKLLNGNYFRYAQNDFLAPRKDGRARDLHAINGRVLNDKLKNVCTQLNLYKDADFAEEDNSEEASNWRQFKKDFRECEFFILSTLRSLPSKEKEDTTKFFFSPESSLPAYMTDYNSNMGFYLFDVMAPFYNIVNIKYAYKRFAEIGDIYDYALNHEWSLLRSMMSAAYVYKGSPALKEGENYTDVAMHCLISDAVIRNSDVHSSIVETMQTNRLKEKETGSTVGLLEKTYNALTKIGMKTYFYSEGKAHEIHFVFLSAIIAFLKESTDEDFEKVFYVNKDDTTENNTGLSQEDSQWLDEHFHSEIQAQYPATGRTIIGRIRKSMEAGWNDYLPRGFWQKIIENKKKYQSWVEVKNLIGSQITTLKETKPFILADAPVEASEIE